MKFILYYIIKAIIRAGLFFYAKKIKISGKENIPKKGAILFAANHPNGLIDPLIIASNISRKTFFLVRAAVFNNPIIAIFFDWLGMMPVYRIRDGYQQLTKNNLIFKKCRRLLHDEKTLLIFPEGTHLRKRTIRPLSKGFTRILFGALNEYPTLKIYVIPVGITFQNPSKYPSKVAINFGIPILANDFYNPKELNNSTNLIKKQVSDQLQNLSVHIPDDENYQKKEDLLNNLQVDYTDVNNINKMIISDNYPSKKVISNNTSLLKNVIILNSLFPYLIWKKVAKKITEIEFVDTFRFGLSIILFPLFYFIQSYLISIFFGWNTAIIYFTTSLLLVAIYTKLTPTPTE
ncbi:1-acyl-sn-glycerol-3-phosphate acyltransferase [Tenacibaculum adriaticum]|uniref:1-acyl-sn-glycerol-3-phosphate acyltransferase n=1 Tax=Tenacibaculum adriaticum TaxID=413713 RepID=A0A5S5DKN2_9FLAO|nr:lysophospholipid acyltransferase family protein [Tenacibaculum adriaticum]TYP96481.1 1-acyl-sn-glycerol-3-phosphate acyltransferase [Tenacibaculum adriaticum]